MQRKFFTIFCAVLITAVSVVLIVILLTFKTGDTDFWWHLKAGQLMLHSGIPILTDPFAWTRSGQPYLATHEWLFEILLYTAWAALNAWGIIALRILLVGSALLTPILLCKKQFYLFAPAAAVTALAISHAVSDRPQLFTFAIFSAVATLCMAYPQSRNRKSILIVLPLLTVLWVNVHGGAALLGLCLFGTLIAEQTFSAVLSRTCDKTFLQNELSPLLLTFGAMIIALFCTPEGPRTLFYLLNLYTDRSAQFISEWQPSAVSEFSVRNGALAVIALLCTYFSRRSLIMSSLMFAGLLFLSRTAVRHEPLFAIVSLVIIARQISNNEWMLRLSGGRMNRPYILCIASLVTIAILCTATWRQMLSSNRFDTFAGIGAFTPMAGAAAHLHSTGMPSHPFNNYNSGGELLYHDVPVFLDGRNLDYGYEYINTAVNAGADHAKWIALDAKYNFDSAIIAYYLQSDMNPLPYTDILDSDPSWQLTYLDDWAAVYRKIDAVSADVLSEYALTQITPKALARLEIPKEIRQSNLALLELELLRMIDNRPDGIFARLYLAKLYASLKLYSAAQERIDEAMKIRPRNFRIWEQQGLLFLEQERYADAGEALEKGIVYAGSDGAVIDYEALADIFKKAGNERKTEQYRRKM